MTEWFEQIKAEFDLNFIQADRWKSLLTGLENTLLITLFAAIIGIIIGIIVAAVRTTYDNNSESMKYNGSISYYILKFFNAICKVYLTVIRGTPVLVQLLIIYYVIFATVDLSKVLVGSIAFGLNSAAYVAEIIRAGINAVPKGQFEAGYSLGLPFKFTMILIILPQAVKNILPALCNEGITLIKETSVSGYIGVMDLTKAGDVIRSQTFEAFMPLIGVAVIYLAMVMILTALVNRLEKRLNKGNGVTV